MKAIPSLCEAYERHDLHDLYKRLHHGRIGGIDKYNETFSSRNYLPRLYDEYSLVLNPGLKNERVLYSVILGCKEKNSRKWVGKHEYDPVRHRLVVKYVFCKNKRKLPEITQQLIAKTHQYFKKGLAA